MSQAKVYVGNLSYNTTEDELRDFFGQYGAIDNVKLIIDFATNRSKGFGFITYASADEAEKAVSANGAELGGRNLKVNIAREDTRREGGSGPRNNNGPRRSFNRNGGGGFNRDRKDRFDRDQF